MAGIAISAETQCSRSRVAGPCVSTHPPPRRRSTAASRCPRRIPPPPTPATVLGRYYPAPPPAPRHRMAPAGSRDASIASTNVLARRHRAAPDQMQPTRGHVDASCQHVGFTRQHQLDQPDTGAALQPIDRQHQFVGAIARVVACRVMSRVSAVSGRGARSAGSNTR